MTLNHTIYDCATGKTTEVPFTKAEQREWDKARAADVEADATEASEVLAKEDIYGPR